MYRTLYACACFGMAAFVYSGFFCHFIYNARGLLIVSSIILLFIILATWLRVRASGKRASAIRLGIWLCFILYCVNLLILLFGYRFSFDGISELGWAAYIRANTNLIPFGTLLENIVHRNFLPLIGNVLLLFPLGIFLPLLRSKLQHTLHFFCTLLLICVFLEAAQLFTKLGSFDVDDMILNVLGGVLGYRFCLGQNLHKVTYIQTNR